MSYAYSDTHRVEVNGARGRVLIDDAVRRALALAHAAIESYETGRRGSLATAPVGI